MAKTVQRALHIFIQILVAKQTNAHQGKTEKAGQEQGQRETTHTTTAGAMGSAGTTGNAALADPNDHCG